jgi:hypothetical protein
MQGRRTVIREVGEPAESEVADWLLYRGIRSWPMSASGHSPTFPGLQAMSASPPEADIRTDMDRGRRSANSVTIASQRTATIHRYSITSSARASSVGGMVMPSDFAVLRLIVRLYLVGVCTGRSSGFSPLRRRSRRTNLSALALLSEATI